ncbi:MAG: efflux transporter outer membrane subunit [Steroidobacteraceae bacterium]
MRRTVAIAAGTLAPTVAALLTACAVGPNYRPPATPVPPAYAAAAQSPGVSAAAGDLRAWWARFRDPELTSLIRRALAGNLDLKSAASRIRAAREQEIIAGAGRLPQLNADASVDRTHISQNSGISEFANLFGGGQGSGGGAGSGSGGVGGIGPPATSFTVYSLGFDASWELDVFGGVRRGIEQAQAAAEQAVWAARDSEVTLAAEVANDYLTLRVLQRQAAIAREEIARQRQTLALIRARRQFGLVTELDVREQQTQLAASQVALPDLHAQIAARIHALGVLLGAPPETLDRELSSAQALPERPPAVPVGLPSALLRRRPDIRAAERALAASNAAVGVAVADLYPRISLTGALGLVSIDLTRLLDGSSRQSSATGALSWPIFAGRQIRANIRVAEEKHRQALYAYRSAVLRSLQDVEDALTRYGDEQKKNAAVRHELSEAQSAADVALAQYKAGLTSFTPVLTAQGTVLTARDALAQSDGALDSDLVSLYKALGGGWAEGSGGAGPAYRARG